MLPLKKPSSVSNLQYLHSAGSQMQNYRNTNFRNARFKFKKFTKFANLQYFKSSLKLLLSCHSCQSVPCYSNPHLKSDLCLLCVGGYAGVTAYWQQSCSAALPTPGSRQQICKLRETPANKPEKEQVGGCACDTIWKYWGEHAWETQQVGSQFTINYWSYQFTYTCRALVPANATKC